MNSDRLQILTTLKERLHWLQSVASGIVYCHPSDFNFVLVEKNHTTVQLSYPDHTLETPFVQSSLDLANPLQLTAVSAQVMLLGLLWQIWPQRIYVGGFGAGRLPWLLHYWFPDAVIQGTDIEPQIRDVSTLFFGIELTNRLQLATADCRRHLASTVSAQPYDLIFIDIAHGNGYMPYSLVTHEFFELCRRQLSEQGVLIINTVPGDRYIAYKMQTLRCTFPTLYVCDTQDNKLIANRILFAMNQPALSQAVLQQRATHLDASLAPTFSFREQGRRLQSGDPLLETYFDEVPTAPLLRDDHPPAGYFDELTTLKPLRLPLRAGLICPCGSGRSFSNCHGQEEP
jgi:spermidine synthase